MVCCQWVGWYKSPGGEPPSRVLVSGVNNPTPGLGLQMDPRYSSPTEAATGGHLLDAQ